MKGKIILEILIEYLLSSVFGDFDSSRLKKRRSTFVTVLTRGTLPTVLCILLVEPKRFLDNRRSAEK